MAQTALKKTADENCDSYPEAASWVKTNSYMDDICDSVKTVEKAKKLTNYLDQVLETGGFKFKGWISNENLHDQDHNPDCNEMKILQGECTDKILGVGWNNQTDSLCFKIKADVLKTTSDQESKLTKRIILSSIARIYDPIGIAAGFMIKAKISMQRSWQLGYGWDEEWPAEVCNEWMKIFHPFEKLNEVSFHRSLTLRRVIASAVLCIFSDASREAFGT